MVTGSGAGRQPGIEAFATAIMSLTLKNSVCSRIDLGLLRLAHPPGVDGLRRPRLGVGRSRLGVHRVRSVWSGELRGRKRIPRFCRELCHSFVLVNAATAAAPMISRQATEKQITLQSADGSPKAPSMLSRLLDAVANRVPLNPATVIPDPVTFILPVPDSRG